MKSDREGCGCLVIIVVGAVIYVALKSFYIGATGFFQQYGQLILNVLFTIAIATMLAVRVERKWTKRSPGAAMASSGIATLVVFLVTTGTRWWSTGKLSFFISYCIASLAFLTIFVLLGWFSLRALRGHAPESEEAEKEREWKEATLLLRLGSAPAWPVATAWGAYFYGAKLSRRQSSE